MFTTMDVSVIVATVVVLLTLSFKWWGLLMLGLLGFYFYGPTLIFSAIWRYKAWRHWGDNKVLIVLCTDGTYTWKIFFPCSPEIRKWFLDNGCRRKWLDGGYSIAGNENIESFDAFIKSIGCEVETKFFTNFF